MKFVPPRNIVPSPREATKAPVISPDPRAQVPLVSGETAPFLPNLDSLDLTKKERTSDPRAQVPLVSEETALFLLNLD